MLTNRVMCLEVCQGHQTVPFDMLRMISYLCSVVILSLKCTVSEIFDFEKCCDLEIRVKGHSRSSLIRTVMDRSSTCDFLLTVTMGLSHTVFKAIKIFATPCILCPHWRGSHWNWVSAHAGKKLRVMGLLGQTRNLTISSAVWIQSTNVTDEHLTTAKTVWYKLNVSCS